MATDVCCAFNPATTYLPIPHEAGVADFDLMIRCGIVKPK